MTHTRHIRHPRRRHRVKWIYVYARHFRALLSPPFFSLFLSLFLGKFAREEIAREKFVTYRDAPRANDVAGDSQSYKSRPWSDAVFRRDCSSIKCIRIVSGVGIGVGRRQPETGYWNPAIIEGSSMLFVLVRFSRRRNGSSIPHSPAVREITWIALWGFCPTMDRRFPVQFRSARYRDVEWKLGC